MMHWSLDIHAVDRNNSSVLQLHCHVLQKGQAQRNWACAHSILIICTLTHKNNNCSQGAVDEKQLAAQSVINVRGKKKKNFHYLYIFDDDRKLPVNAVLCEQILTVTSEGEKLVVKGFEVWLAHHQALTYTQAAETLQQEKEKIQVFLTEGNVSSCVLCNSLTRAAFIGTFPGAMTAHTAKKVSLAGVFVLTYVSVHI